MNVVEVAEIIKTKGKCLDIIETIKSVVEIYRYRNNIFSIVTIDGIISHITLYH